MRISRSTSNDLTGSVIDGSNSNPSISFADDTTTGLYRNSSGGIGLSVQGVERMAVNASNITTNVPLTIGASLSVVGNIQSSDGTANAPSYSFTADTNTGMYRDGNDQLGFSVNGFRRGLISMDGITSDNRLIAVNPTAFVDTYSTNNTLGSSIGGMVIRTEIPGRSSGITWMNGNAVTTRGFFMGGLYNGANPITNFVLQGSTSAWGNSIGGTSGANNLLRIHYDTGELRVKDGTATAPIYSFISDTNSGMYSVGEDQLGFTTGGVQRMVVGNSNITCNVQLIGGSISGTSMIAFTSFNAPAGSVGLPSYTFSGDTNTGMYRVDADQLGFTTGGVQRMVVGNSNISMSLPTVVTNITSSGNIQSVDGNATVPSYSFTTDNNTGMYSAGADQLGFSSNGINRLNLNGDGLLAQYFSSMYMNISTTPAGVTTPCILFASRGNNVKVSGVFTFNRGSNSSNGRAFSIEVNIDDVSSPITTIQWGITKATGFQTDINQVSLARVVFNSVNYWALILPGGPDYAHCFGYFHGTVINGPLLKIATIDTTNVDLTITDQRYPNISNVYNGQTYIGGSILGLNGTATAPSYSFTSDTNTGMYSAGADQIGFTTGGVQRMVVANSAVTSSIPLRTQNGSVGAPAYSFTDATTTGLMNASSALQVISQTQTCMTFSDTSVSTELPLSAFSIACTDQPRVTVGLNTHSIANDTFEHLGGNSTVLDSKQLTVFNANTTPYSIQLNPDNDGVYYIQATAIFSANATGQRRLRINVANAVVSSITVPAWGSGNTELSTSAVVPLASNQLCEFTTYQNSGGSLNVQGGALRIVKLS